MKSRYKLWVENLKWDWCISRQRYFGVPFPVWYCRDCKKPIFAVEEQLPVNPIESQPLQPCECGCNVFTPEDAVLTHGQHLLLRLSLTLDMAKTMIFPMKFFRWECEAKHMKSFAHGRFTRLLRACITLEKYLGKIL